MGKLVAGLARMLPLCALLFVLPSLAASQSVTLQPDHGPAGTSVTGTGTIGTIINGHPGDRIQVLWYDASFTLLANTNVRSDGTFSVSFNIPSNATSGAHIIIITDLDAGQGKTGYAIGSPNFTVGAGQNQVAPKIVHVEPFVEGVLVFFRLFFTDPSSIAVGFGFKGVNGSGWAEENHPFTSPSFGRVFPGIVEYPFNHLCGQPGQYESDVEAWIYDNTGRRSPSVTVHLACSTSALSVTKKAAPKSADIGGLVLYQIVVTNNSNKDATNVTLDDELPFELWPLKALSPDTNPRESILSTQGHCSYYDRTSTDPIKVHCDLGKIATGGHAVITYEVEALLANPGDVSNLVTVKNDQSTPTTVKETVSLVRPSGLSDKEVNDILASIRECGPTIVGLTTESAFLDLVNPILDQLNRKEITGLQFKAKIVEITLGALGKGIRSHALELLSDLFSIPACIKYGALLFSIELP